MKISASLYSSQQKDLPSLVYELDELKLDFFHIDCFDTDEQKVVNDMITIKNLSSTAIDLHVISNRVQHFINLANDCKVAQLCFQFENLPEEVVFPQQRDFLLGLAITNETPLEKVKPFQEAIDYVLLMTTTPGKSGGIFKTDSFKRIREAKKMFPNKAIYVDGGINAEVSFILRLLGVQMAVSGSFLVNNINIATALADLRFHQKGSSFLIEDFMMPKNELPVLDIQEANFLTLLETVENHKLGFALIEKDGQFYGVCSNADIRRALLKNKNNLNQTQGEQAINTNARILKSKSTIYEMLGYLKILNVPILFLPVLDEQNKLVGALTFNEFIKGEG